MSATADETLRAAPVTVLVCTRGRGEFLPDCVRAITAALRPCDELLVVEASGEAAREVVAALGDPRCRWIRAERLGKTRQLNDGAAVARGEVIAITDDDCRVPAGWVAAMAAAFLEPGVGIAFGPVRGLSRTPGSDASAAPPPGPAGPEMWAHTHGAAMAVSAAALREVGGFDERLGPGAPARAGEEMDLLLRLERAGWRAWRAGAPTVEHLEWRRESQDTRNALVYERGGGAWFGAALRRDPIGARRALKLRLKYQLGHFRGNGKTTFVWRAQLAFLSGVALGLRMTPARAAVERPPSVAMPWPTVRGQRCLDVSTPSGSLAAELERRGAREVVKLDAAALPGVAERGRFDVVTSTGLLAHAAEPAAALAAVREVCDGWYLVVEPLDLPATILSPHRPRVRVQPGAGTRVLNGAAQRSLLGRAGFEVRAVSPFFACRAQADPGPHAQPGARLLQRLLIGDARNGTPRQALLGVPRAVQDAGAQAG